MAWYNSGAWSMADNVPVMKMSEILAELGYAINEREVIAGGSATSFGIGGTYPTQGDFSGTPVGAHALKVQVQAYQTAIDGLCASNKFYDPVALIPYTSAEALDQAGLGASWITPTRIQDAAAVRQIKAVLELLVYTTKPVHWSAVSYIKYQVTGTSQQNAWDNCIAQSENVNSDTFDLTYSSPPYIGWQQALVSGTYYAAIGTRMRISCDTPATAVLIPGTIACEEKIFWEFFGNPDAFTATGADGDIVCDLTGSAFTHATRAVSMAVPSDFYDPDIGYFDVVWSVPSTRPGPTIVSGSEIIERSFGCLVATSTIDDAVVQLTVPDDLTYG